MRIEEVTKARIRAHRQRVHLRPRSARRSSLLPHPRIRSPPLLPCLSNNLNQPPSPTLHPLLLGPLLLLPLPLIDTLPLLPPLAPSALHPADPRHAGPDDLVPHSGDAFGSSPVFFGGVKGEERGAVNLFGLESFVDQVGLREGDGRLLGDFW